MRSALVPALFAALALLAACSSSSTPAPAPKSAPKPPRPADHSRRFPAEGRLDVQIVDDHLLGHDFLPGGNLAHFKQGKLEYDVFLIRSANPQDAALLLLAYKKALTDAKFIAHFGGYAGKDGAKPAFLFAKAEWLCGILGLPEADADLAARALAVRLN